MDLNSFLTSLGTSFVIFIVLVLIFAWLSRKPGNAVVYYPNRILRGVDTTGDGSTRNPFSWIMEAISSTEKEIISVSGVDAAAYFVFLATVLGILVVSGMVLLPVLLPVAATDNYKSTNGTSNAAFSDLDKISMGHLEEKSPRLWFFVAATYWVSFVAYYLLWKAYDHVSNLRAAALMSPKVRAEQFAVLVRDIPPPKDQTRKEQIDTYFKAIYPDAYYRSMIITDNAEVNKIWKELEGYKKKLVRLEVVYAESKKTNPDESKPTHKTGLLGLLGEKVDSIEYYNKKINELVPKLEAEQKATLREKQQASALVFFTSRVTAASAAQSLHPRLVDTWTVTDAPEPAQMLWPNLKKKFIERQIRQYVIYTFVALMILFYIIPIAFISAFTTLENLRKFLPFLKAIVDIDAIKTILEAYLPQLALFIFLALLPKLLLFLSKAEGIPSKSHVERAASGKYFYFTVFNVFIGVTVGGTLFGSLKQIEKQPNKIVDLLATSLPANATFFLTFVALKFFVGYGFELSRIFPLIIYHLKKKYICTTDEDVKEAWAPRDLGFATRIPNDMLVVTIVFCYSVIAPIIIPFGVLYFGIGWLVLRNQVLKVYVPKYESYGRMWPHINTRLVASLLLYQVTMFGYFGIKKFYYVAILVPLPILSLIFAYLCKKKFYRFFKATALEVACRELKETPDMETIFRSFIPPSLSADKAPVDEEQSEDALSQVSRAVTLAV